MPEPVRRRGAGDGRIELRPVRRGKSLKERAYAEIRRLILDGRLEPGQVVSAVRLAAALQISRTPVREALLDLVKEGLVAAVPRRGIVVRRVSEGERQEVFLLRQAVETLLVEAAARRLTPADLQRLRRILARQRELAGAGDEAAFIDADHEFHLAIAQTTGMAVAARILGTLGDLSRLIGLEAVRHPGRGREVVAEHERIVAALEAGDVPAARRAMREHLLRTEGVITGGSP